MKYASSAKRIDAPDSREHQLYKCLCVGYRLTLHLLHHTGAMCQAVQLVLATYYWLHKRQCVECRLTLQGPLPAGTISQAVQPAVHDLTDNSVARSWLNNPLSGSLATDIYKATNIVRSFAQASCPSLCSQSV